MAVTDVTNGKYAAIQQRVISNQFTNTFKMAPTQIKNFFKTKASAITQPKFFKASQASFASPIQGQSYHAAAATNPITEQPLGFVQSAKNQFIKGFNKLAQKPVQTAVSQNIAAQNVGFNTFSQKAAAPIVGIQTEAAQIKNAAYKPASAINQNLNAVNQPINQAASAYQQPLNIANNAPKASAWSQSINSGAAINQPINSAVQNNLAQNIVSKEGSALGVQAAESINKIPMGFAAI